MYYIYTASTVHILYFLGLFYCFFCSLFVKFVKKNNCILYHKLSGVCVFRLGVLVFSFCFFLKKKIYIYIYESVFREEVGYTFILVMYGICVRYMFYTE